MCLYDDFCFSQLIHSNILQLKTKTRDGQLIQRLRGLPNVTVYKWGFFRQIKMTVKLFGLYMINLKNPYIELICMARIQLKLVQKNSEIKARTN